MVPQEGDHGAQAGLTRCFVADGDTAFAREEGGHGHFGKAKGGSEKPGISAWQLVRRIRRRRQDIKLRPGRFQVQAAEANVEDLAVFVMAEITLGQRSPGVNARTTQSRYISRGRGTDRGIVRALMNYVCAQMTKRRSLLGTTTS